MSAGANDRPDAGAPIDGTPSRGQPDDRADPLAGNPYSTQYRQAAVPDLDAGAPQLRSHDLRRMNQRALLLLALIILLLLFVAYWMLGGAGKRGMQAKPHEEKVTVAEAPRSIALPQRLQRLPPLPTRQAEAIPLAPLPALPPLPPRPPAPVAQTTREPTLMQRRIGDGVDTYAAGQQPAADPPTRPGAGLAGNLTPVTAQPSQPTSARTLPRPGTLMQRGTYIRCVLETRIVSDIPGFASCLVTERVYSFNGSHLLLPKGSKLLGTYDKSPIGRRVAVVWDRIITPGGIDVNMASPGMDQLGGAGLPGHYDAHWGSRIGSALLISMLSDAFKYEAAEQGPRSTAISNGVVTQQPFESNTAQTVQNLADQAVREAANRPPTVTINQGTIIYVYVARDVDFSGVVARY